MQSPAVRLRLQPGTTARQLMAQGMPESSAYRILKQGWHCPGYNQRCYPQHDGSGGFAHLETPERFVRASVLRTLEQWDIVPRRELVEDLTLVPLQDKEARRAVRQGAALGRTVI